VKNPILLSLLVFFPLLSFCQEQVSKFEEIDSIATNLPAVQSKTIDQLADFINQHFQMEEEKSRFAFTWMATHIRYDINCALGKNSNQQDATTVMTMHEGVCDGYSNLFAALCERCHVTCIKVGGVCTKNNYANHSWNAVNVNGTWNLVDITWSAGGVNPAFEFVPQFTDGYYFMPAANFIREHLPFDQMWQLLFQPVSKKNFYTGNLTANVSAMADTFYYNDTIRHFFSLDSLSRERDYFRRSYSFDTENAYLKEGRISTLMNQAVGFLVKGDPFFTNYYDLKHHAFDDADFFVQSENRARTLLDSVNKWYSLSKNTYDKLPPATTSVNADAVNKNRTIINQRIEYLKEEQAFIDLYFSSPQSKRLAVLQSHSQLLKLTQ
jgi:hypothetical protein